MVKKEWFSLKVRPSRALRQPFKASQRGVRLREHFGFSLKPIGNFAVLRATRMFPNGIGSVRNLFASCSIVGRESRAEM